MTTKTYDVRIRIETSSAEYSTERVAAAVALSLSDSEFPSELAVRELAVEQEA